MLLARPGSHLAPELWGGGKQVCGGVGGVLQGADNDAKWWQKDARLLVSLHFRSENQAETESER